MMCKPMEDDDDDPDPERVESPQKTPEPAEEESKEPVPEQAAKYLPAFALTTGVYEFYRQNPFTQAYHRAVLAGQLLAVLISRARLFNANPVSLLGFSLGAVFAHAACLALHDLKSPPSLGDVCLLGACVDLLAFGQTLHKLIGSRGVVQGKLTVVFSSHDSVLAYLFRSARLGETPIGLKRIDRGFLLDSLADNDPELAKLSRQDLDRYLSSKFANVDATALINGHLEYRDKLTRVLQLIDFNGGHLTSNFN